MIVRRRTLLGAAMAIAAVGASSPAIAFGGALEGAMEETAKGEPYGMIARILAKPGQRAALAVLLSAGTDMMPGCLSYVVAEDLANPDALWVTEAWESKAAHGASLSLPAVREAISKAQPLIAGFDSIAETRPIGGVPVAQE
ncbi:antibiotic biosynthesis monooxygenase [Sphingomonas alpina]|uniref:Antibiotic biosynthesis monooxygenase n=2 Tax=Sphingomonas alpina TaxID=653931 RepID=A0A7H0LQL8_9SPHN|nr:antibiotic biosynthesis monooxygenase [Sphingomonas alpina]